MRQGCARSAAVSLVFDAVGREVWLDAVVDGATDPASGSQAQLLCPGHAEALRVPVGWAVVDRRPPLTPRADGADGADGAGDGDGADGAGDGADDTGVQGTLVPEPDAAVPPADEPAAVEAEAPAEQPPAGAGPAGALRRGSMLDRAFAWAGPQRSVITDRGDTGDPSDPADTETE